MIKKWKARFNSLNYRCMKCYNRIGGECVVHNNHKIQLADSRECSQRIEIVGYNHEKDFNR